MHPIRLSALALASLALLAAGCGSTSPPASSVATSNSPQNFAAAAFKYAHCMGTHGVPNFPDPRVTTSSGHQEVGIRVTPAATSAPQFKAADAACRGIIPAPSPSQIAAHRRTELAGKLSFAQCVRHHGITNFPDPNAQGELTLHMVNAAGVDLHAQGVLAAAKACVGASHGTISKADVDQAIKNAGRGG